MTGPCVKGEVASDHLPRSTYDHECEITWLSLMGARPVLSRQASAVHCCSNLIGPPLWTGRQVGSDGVARVALPQLSGDAAVNEARQHHHQHDQQLRQQEQLEELELHHLRQQRRHRRAGGAEAAAGAEPPRAGAVDPPTGPDTSEVAAADIGGQHSATRRLHNEAATASLLTEGAQRATHMSARPAHQQPSVAAVGRQSAGATAGDRGVVSMQKRSRRHSRQRWLWRKRRWVWRKQRLLQQSDSGSSEVSSGASVGGGGTSSDDGGSPGSATGSHGTAAGVHSLAGDSVDALAYRKLMASAAGGGTPRSSEGTTALESISGTHAAGGSSGGSGMDRNGSSSPGSGGSGSSGGNNLPWSSDAGPEGGAGDGWDEGADVETAHAAATRGASAGVAEQFGSRTQAGMSGSTDGSPPALPLAASPEMGRQGAAQPPTAASPAAAEPQSAPPPPPAEVPRTMADSRWGSFQMLDSQSAQLGLPQGTSPAHTDGGGDDGPAWSALRRDGAGGGVAGALQGIQGSGSAQRMHSCCLIC